VYYLEIKVSNQQYRELVHMIALQGFSEAILSYWNDEFDELKNKKVKLSKNTASMLQKFIVQLNNTMLQQKQKYVELVTNIAKENNYEIDENTTVVLDNENIAIILQQTADTKEND
jgi:hypothetical protein